jgi:putative peptide zinc metalloprotease protein
MAESPSTFSESWYRVANQRPSLRPTVQVQRSFFRGERWIILQNPLANQFFRLRPEAYEFVARLRPDKTVEEVWRECLHKSPDRAPGQEAVIRLLAQLYQANLLQYPQANDAAELFKRYERTRQRERQMRFFSVMFARFPLLDPDWILVRTMPVVGKLISPAGGLIWLGTVLAGLKIVADNFAELRNQVQGILDPGNLILLYLGLVILKVLHEFGHAYFCRKFGGEVHTMGIMLMVFTPIPYMDATSAWGFRERWKRALVGASGMIVELFVAALAAFVWANTGQGTLHSLAYNMIFVASVSTLIFNLNPLLRFDGYYILSDLLQIPNLNQRSNQQLRFLAERFLFGLKKAESPSHSRREATWLVVYGILSGIYRLIVFGGILLLVADRFLLIGILMAAVCAIAWVIRPLTRLVIYLVSSPKLERNRIRAVAVTAAMLAGIVLLFQWVPFPHHFRAPGVLLSRQYVEVHNWTPGYLEKIRAAPGGWVEAGVPLIQMVNPELELNLQAARANYGEMEARIRQARQEATPNLKPLNSLLESAAKRIARLEADQKALTVLAPQAGVWILPRAEEYPGRWLAKGSSLGLLVSTREFLFHAVVRQEDVDRLFAQNISQTAVRLFGQGDREIPVNELRIVPGDKRNLPSVALGWTGGGPVAVSMDDPEGRQAAEPFFEVRAQIVTQAESALLHGRSGKIRFTLPSEPLLPRWIRSLRQLLQKRYQL